MPGYIETCLRDEIEDLTILDDFVTASIMVVLGCWTIPKAKRWLKAEIGYEAIRPHKDIFARLLDSGLLVATYKLAALRLIVHNDVEEFYRLGFGRHTKVELLARKGKIRYALKGRIALPISDSDRSELLNRLSTTLIKEMTRFVGKRLRFVWKYDNGMPIDQIAHDLLMKAVWMFWRTWPYVSEAHLFNICRTTAYNEARHIQRDRGSADNSRIINLGVDAHGKTSFLLANSPLKEGLVAQQQISIEEDISARELREFLFKDIQDNALVCRASTLILMEDDEPFMKFVGSNNLSELKDEIGANEYDQKIAEFLDKPLSWVTMRRVHLQHRAHAFTHTASSPAGTR